jgi:NTP pyrophosphatase (non-canonical NTP hydrolase)
MTKREDVNVDYNNADKAAKATENVMNHMQDVKEGMSDNASKVAEDTPTTPEEFINKKGFTAWRAAEEVKTKQKQKDTAEKFAVDLDKYLDFADNTCSEFSKDHAAYIKRLNDLQELGCNISRLDTAASGLSAESGEFMEIVKKMKFQGKPWNDENKEHLTKELGDIMWYAAQAAMALGVRLDDVIYINTLKLAKRYSGGAFNVSDSENRAQGDI